MAPEKNETINAKIERIKTEMQQLENRAKRLAQSQRQLERKARTRRLIERGAILESALPSVNTLSGNELMSLLVDISRLPDVRSLLTKTMKTEGTE